MIAAGLGTGRGPDLRSRILQLAQFANAPFDSVVGDANRIVAACTPGCVDDTRPAVWIGTGAAANRQLATHELTGAFAFAAIEEEGLLLGRGRFGGHPLYYARDPDGSLIACSQLDPLVQLMGGRMAFDPSRMTELLLNLPGSAATLYEGIRRLGSGELLSVRPTSETRRHLPALGTKSAPRTDVREIGEELVRLVGAAVVRAVGPSKRIAVSVGGLDSSALLASAIIARQRGASSAEVSAVTLHFAGLNDDRKYVSDVCRALDIEPVRLAPAECANFVLCPPVIDAAPATYATAPWVLKTARWATERGLDAVLDGEGGDKLLDGDLNVFSRQAFRGHPLWAIREARRLRGLPHLAAPRRRMSVLVLRPAAKRLLPALARFVQTARVRERVRTDFQWAGPALRPTLEANLAINRVEDDLATGGEMVDYKDFCQQCLLYTGCRQAQPYLDDQLVDFIASLPKELLFYGGYRRGLFRFAFRDILPKSLLQRETKSGFGEALAQTFSAAGGAKRIEPYLPMRMLSQLGFVDPTGFRTAADRLLRRPNDSSVWLNVWPALALEAFLLDRDLRDRARADLHH